VVPKELPPSFRQIQIAQLLADGYRLADAAAYLYITRNTAKRHLDRLAERLGKRGQIAIVVEMMRRGLVT
jgi:DNA-binding NarL/FixJ family response regulator